MVHQWLVTFSWPHVWMWKQLDPDYSRVQRGLWLQNTNHGDDDDVVSGFLFVFILYWVFLFCFCPCAGLSMMIWVVRVRPEWRVLHPLCLLRVCHGWWLLHQNIYCKRATIRIDKPLLTWLGFPPHYYNQFFCKTNLCLCFLTVNKESALEFSQDFSTKIKRK